MEEIKEDLEKEELNVYKEYCGMHGGTQLSRNPKILIIGDIPNDEIKDRATKVICADTINERYEVIIGDLFLNKNGLKSLPKILESCDHFVCRVSTEKDKHNFSDVELRNSKDFVQYHYFIKCLKGNEFWIWSPKLDFESLFFYTEALTWTYFTSYIKNQHKKALENVPLMDREDLKKIDIKEDTKVTKTLGTTDEPVYIPVTNERNLSHTITTLRAWKWRGWTPGNTVAAILENTKEDKQEGTTYYFTIKPVAELQCILENLKPSYIITHPSIASRLDLPKIIGLQDIQTTGEPGGSCYYMEETGTIALQCPDNPQIMHVMENIIIEYNDTPGADRTLTVTDITNPAIKRYITDDYGSLMPSDFCPCGRKLEVISRVPGRVRNIIKMVGKGKGIPFWPFDQYVPCREKMYQILQVSSFKFVVKFEKDDPLSEKEKKEISGHIKKCFPTTKEEDLEFRFEEIDNFPMRKFERFICCF